MSNIFLGLARLRSLITAGADQEGQLRYVRQADGTLGALKFNRKKADNSYEWADLLTLTSAEDRGHYTTGDSHTTAAPDTSTTDTVVWATALSFDFTLPAGTWTVRGHSDVMLTHSAGGAVGSRLLIDNDVQDGRALTPTSATLPLPVHDYSVLSGCSGATNVKVQFISVDAGTTAARNPWVAIEAERTA